MAKATATCKCIECKQEFIKTKECLNRKEANKWEQWAIDSFTLCSKCYAAKQTRLEQKKDLYVDIRLDLYSVFKDEPPVVIIFGGKTKQNKEKIKELGADWTHDYPSEGGLFDFMDTRKSGFRWVIRCNKNEINTKLLEIKKIGAKINNLPSKTDISIYLDTLKEYESVKRDYHLAIEELGAIPSWSSEINDIWPEGATWNGKFYGKSGKWCVYLLNEKIALTDEQKKSMEETINQRNIWKKKKKEIDNKYKKIIR